MWATYSDNHRGVCLVIEKKRFIEENKLDNTNNYLMEVEYSSEASNQLHKKDKNIDFDYNKAAQELIQHNLKKVFFSKHPDWITENEIRMITDSCKNYCSIMNSLITIILGLDFNLKYRPAIIEQLRKNNLIERIPIKKIKFNHLNGELELG